MTDVLDEARTLLAKHVKPYMSEGKMISALIGEVERLRAGARLDAAVIERLRRAAPPCDGYCNPNDGPDERCSAHGRTPADLWAKLDRVRQQRDEALAKLSNGSATEG